MKLKAKSYLIVTAIAVVALAGCATGPASKQEQSAAAARVLAAYDVPDLLAQAAPAVAQSLDKNLPDAVGAAERKRLQNAIRAAYDPVVLQNDVAARLREKAAESGHQNALVEAAAKLETPLAERMIGLESTTGRDNFAEDFKAFVQQPATEARQRRLDQIRTLAESMQIIDLQTAFNATLLEAMLHVRNAASDAEYQVEPARLDRMIESTRGNIDSKLQQRVPLMLLYVFRDVDDATLASYLELQTSPELVWTNRALKESIVGTLEAAGEKMVSNYNQGG